MLKLDLNESPHSVEPGHDYARLDYYNSVKQKLAKYVGVGPENVVITNGSYHALELIFSFLFRHQDRILLPIPTFPFYNKHEEAGRLKFVKIPYDANLLSVLNKQKVAGLYLANPNNPVGHSIAADEIEKIVACAKRKKALVIIDEAYFEFCGVTVVNLVNKHDNLLVVRTFSKAFGLAGARFGYIVTNEPLATRLEKLKGPPYIINHLALNFGYKALTPAKQRRVQKRVRENNQIRRRLTEFITENGHQVFPSQTNFVTFRTNNSAKLVAAFAQRKILLKDLDDYPDGQMIIKDCVRMTIPPMSQWLRIKKELVRLL